LRQSFGRFRWSSVEVDLLKDAMSAMNQGEQITRYDGHSVKTDRRTISRQELRQRRPLTATRASWERQFKNFPISDPAEIK
jgi:hypothetical protein